MFFMICLQIYDLLVNQADTCHRPGRHRHRGIESFVGSPRQGMTDTTPATTCPQSAGCRESMHIKSTKKH